MIYIILIGEVFILKIVIVGAGAVGAYFGARLEEAGQHVTFLVRKNRARQLEEEGLHITSPHGNYLFNQLNLVEDVNQIEHADLVILSVKGYHLEGTLPALRTLVERGAKILPLLNGLEHIPILQEQFGEEAVLGGFAYIITTLNEKGHVIHSSQNHDLIFGPLHPSQTGFCEELEQVMSTAIIDARQSKQILMRMWNKYMFITAFSGVTTAVNLPIGTIRQSPSTFNLLHKVLIEMKNLANAYHVSISEEQLNQAVTNLQTLPHESTSSMHQDRRKGLTLEVEHLQGGALRLANKAGIQLPVIETLYGLIKPFEH